MMKIKLVIVYGAADSTSIDATEMYVAACCCPSDRLAFRLMYSRRPTRRRVKRVLRAMEMEKYGRENWIVVCVQREASGRDAWNRVKMPIAEHPIISKLAVCTDEGRK